MYDETCSTCKFYVKYNGFGHCQNLPPCHVVEAVKPGAACEENKIIGAWPIIKDPDDEKSWCGEWKAIP